MIIQVPNPFNYHARKEFLPKIQENPVDSELTLDFEGVSSLDSAALGMLLMAREQCKGVKGRISLINCSEPVKQILTIAQFHMLFDIS
ncbi:MAG: STAS domain-containing protein [Magnetococcales bacterium]|nr:STAS domain-containing protein [Magnetococcales bacterium]